MFGTFYLAQGSAPYPFDPFFGALPVFDVRPGTYLVDDTKVDYLAGNVQKAAILSEAGVGASMAAMSSPAPCSPCPTNGGGGGSSFSGPPAYSYSSTNLWLEIALGTNASTALITLHNTTNGVRYQLLSRPEVAVPPWLVEQTLFGAVGTNTITTVLFNERPLLFFQAGVDSDGDGLVDYWESVWGTNPNSTDTDGDGVNDYVEVVQGRNPNDVNGAVSDTTGLVNLQVYTPLR
jgi:Bacterial TSP3 repeat